MVAAYTGLWSMVPQRSSRTKSPAAWRLPNINPSLVPAGRRPHFAWRALCALARVFWLGDVFLVLFWRVGEKS